MALSIECASRTPYKLNLYVDGLSSGWTSADGTRIAKWYIKKDRIPTESSYDDNDAVNIIESTTNVGVSSGGDVSFSGLEPATQYGVACYIYHGSTFLAKVEGWVWSSVTKWSWTSSNGTATDEQTDNARIAILYNGYTKDFHHKVWNDMVSKVNDIVKVCKHSWDGWYASYEDTKMTTEPYTLTAVKFNSLRNNIEIVGKIYLNLDVETNIPVVSIDDTVKGEYFNELSYYINACITFL